MTEILNFPKSPEERSETVINSADSFSTLESALDELGKLPGSDGSTYSADELIDLINRVRAGELSLNHITRSSGLRGKVESLLVEDQSAGMENGHSNVEHKEDVASVESQGTETYFENVSQNPDIKLLLGHLFGPENINQVRRSGQVEYVFTPEQLKLFLDKYPDPASFNNFLADYRLSLDRKIEMSEDSYDKAYVRDVELKSFNRLAEDTVRIDEMKRALYSKYPSQ